MVVIVFLFASSSCLPLKKYVLDFVWISYAHWKLDDFFPFWNMFESGSYATVY